MSLLLATALTQSIVPALPAEISREDPCAWFDLNEEKLQSGQGAGEARRLPTALDLVRIADIGRSIPDEAPAAFGISPDGKQLAVLVKRANPHANGYCQKLVLVSMDGTGIARELDRGGEYIRADFSLRESSAITAGWDKENTPRWSPDGARVAYLKRVDGSTQVWIVDARGSEPAQLATLLPDNVDGFAWDPDGDALIVASRPALRLRTQAIAQEADRGYLFDERFVPHFVDRPIPTGPLPYEFARVELDSGKSRVATSEEAELVFAGRPPELPSKARRIAKGPAGYLAWSEPKHPEQLLSPSRLVLAGPGDQRIICDARHCEGTRGMWWSASQQALLAVQKTGWAKSQEAILRWDIGENEPRHLLVTDDVLLGCTLWQEELLCAREGSTRPRRIVAIDLIDGSERVVFDPNPHFASLALGKVTRFRFRNSYGAESYADLVLPQNHRPGEKHPLVVVQYISHGFLRGGLGDEVPIQLLAARGFAVLSFARPYVTPAAIAAKTYAELRSANRKDWIDRRRVQASLEKAIELAIATGAVDADRMGISGLSDGTSTVQWALINSSLFKAASIGSCCEGMYSYPLAAGPAFTDYGREMGYRFFEDGMEEFWKPMSLALNVEKIHTPILIQSADSEYEAGLDVFETFSHRGKAIEFYVFEDETHIKWQPAHRLAIYERSTEWFEFWLMNRLNCDPSRADQNRRWMAMKGAPAESQLRCYGGT